MVSTIVAHFAEYIFLISINLTPYIGKTDQKYRRTYTQKLTYEIADKNLNPLAKLGDRRERAFRILTARL